MLKYSKILQQKTYQIKRKIKVEKMMKNFNFFYKIATKKQI